MSKHSTGTSYIHKFQNTTEISHIFFHQYKVPNHDKVNSVYCHDLQELFHYQHNSEWK